MKYTYIPRGVCSRQIEIDLSENGIINDCQFMGGCSGNTNGICSLIKGMDAEQAIQRLKGIRCGNRPTSCPDQLATALEEALEMI